jgi:hypothetical protein
LVCLRRRAGIWRIPPERSKTGGQTGDPHDVPLSLGARRVLLAIRKSNFEARVAASPYLFPAAADRKGVALGRDEEARRAVRLNAFMGKPNKGWRTLRKPRGLPASDCTTSAERWPPG